MEPVTFTDVRLEGGELIIKVPRESLGRIMGWIRKKKIRPYDLVIKEHREKRSLSANAYAWVLIDKLAKEQGITKLEVYRFAIQEIGGNSEIYIVPADGVEKFCQIWKANGDGWVVTDTGPSVHHGYREMRCYYGSSVYDTKQMSLLIDSLVQDCKALGIETLPPEKLALLKEEWH